MPEINDNIADTSVFKDDGSPASKIKVVGVGGGGCNALNYMYHQEIPHVSFAALNTDRQHLYKTIDVPVKIVMGPGLGAGDKPEVGRKYAEESEEKLRALFRDDCEMVFVTAGMGGGTGTGAGPVVARIAKEEKKLTIGIITIPFMFEGQNKIRKAVEGAEEMKKYVDALLVINNQNLVDIYSDLTLINAFKKADDTLANAARSISEIISEDCYINVDMNDVNTTLRDSGTAIISTAYGEGDHRIYKAIENAMHSPLLKEHDIKTARRILIKLSHADDTVAQRPVKIDELNELAQFTDKLSKNYEVKWGVGVNNTLGDRVKITLLASGFDITLREPNANDGGIRIPFDDGADDGRAVSPEPAATSIGPIYDPDIVHRQQRMLNKARYAVLRPEQLDDDEVIALVESTPAFNRGSKFREVFEALSVKSTVQIASEADNQADNPTHGETSDSSDQPTNNQRTTPTIKF